MIRRAFRALLVIAFAAAVGHLAWHSLLGSSVPEYLVGGDVIALAGPPAGEHKQLYLRRTFHLGQRPRHAWLSVVGRDEVEIYVNGKPAEAVVRGPDDAADNVRRPSGEPAPDGVGMASVVDLAPYLAIGPNVIAIAAKQISADRPPVVAVEGAYSLSDGEHRLQADSSWRCSTLFERGATWWFARDFSDRHWETARLVSCHLRGKVETPPRAITERSVGQWITPDVKDAGQSVAVRREFDVPQRPTRAWLRVTTASPYRLAVNGAILDRQEDQLDVKKPLAPVQRIYDITAAVQQGRNVLAFLLTSPFGPSHVLADVEVEDEAGQRVRLGTDQHWLCRAGVSSDWLKVDTQAADWRACTAEVGDLDIAPWQPRRVTVALALPSHVVLQRLGQQLGLVAAIALATFLACWLAGFVLAGMAYLALVLPTLAVSAAILATYDPRLAAQSIYHTRYLIAALLAVPVQWLMLTVLRFVWRARPASSPARYPMLGAMSAAVVLLALLAAGGWLRARDLMVRPLTHDETTVYRNTEGFLERGFPSRKAHEDLPVQYVQTSELIYLGTGLTALFSDDPRDVVRIPPLVFGTLTILLMYVVGRRLFGTWVGLIAAAIYAFAPNCIQMACYGRYLSQLQFFTLLTVYAYWQTIRGAGALNARWLGITALSFSAMFLTWEGSALLAPGMIVAGLLQRRGRLHTIFGSFAVWISMVIVGMIVVLQLSHRQLQLTQMLFYGTGAADTSLRPMWNLPDFELFYYVWAASWSRDSLLPILLGVLGGGMLAVRHAFRRSARFLIVILLATCLLTSLLLSLKAWRYGYHLTPLLVLLAAATIVAVTRELARLAAARMANVPRAWRLYAGAVGACVVLVAVALGSGMTVQLSEMRLFRIPGSGMEALGMDALVFSEHAGAVQFVRDRLQPGDVVMADRPHLVELLMGRRPEYFPQSKLYVQGVLDDRRSVPLHRYAANVIVTDRASVEDVFARHPRVWYISRPQAQRLDNEPEVTALIRQHMDIVYEDFSMMVLLRGHHHRTAQQRAADEKALDAAKIHLLR